MQLKKKYTSNFLVPMYDIDLVWHTHQLLATDYKKDTTEYFGRFSLNRYRMAVRNTKIITLLFYNQIVVAKDITHQDIIC